ncbi:hypothetical protein KC19_4G208700 [Ceratodon purpureus]|uniref:Uncharacterized protein n=1 Tax=Ceratodon purpureus TaxID=3225 RepID=A0A8T0IDA8_CERPU|nr:hypothetical protein KC19_4G208700 [Ceratodon purpureus]
MHKDISFRFVLVGIVTYALWESWCSGCRNTAHTFRIGKKGENGRQAPEHGRAGV